MERGRQSVIQRKDSFLLEKEKKAGECRDGEGGKRRKVRSKRKKERRRKREELREVEEEEDGQGRWGWGKALTLVKKNRTPVKTVMISPASLR